MSLFLITSLHSAHRSHKNKAQPRESLPSQSPPPPGLSSSSSCEMMHGLGCSLLETHSATGCGSAACVRACAQVCGGWGGCPETLQIPMDVSIPF